MENLTSDEIREILIDMISKFHIYCEENDLLYCLYGGTLLGAIRHKGFIPWDDDIDLVMPRPDYIRLKELMSTKPIEGLKVVDFQSSSDYYLPFMKIIDTNTQVSVTGTKDQKLGLFIDIFPMDGFTQNRIIQKVSMIRARINFYLLYLWLDDKKKPKNLRGYINEWLLKPIIKKGDGKKFSRRIENMTKKYNYNDDESFIMLSHTLLARRMYNKCDFFPVEKAEFEGLLLNVPRGWDKCLTNAYGNYMELPPIEQRVEKHRLNVKMTSKDKI